MGSSKEGQVVECDREVAEQSTLIKTMLEDVTEGEDEIPLPNVSTDVLNKVLEFCKYQKDKADLEIERPLKSANLADVVPAWYAAYVTVDSNELLFEIIMAANYLDIKSLLDLSCAKVASMIKGKTPKKLDK